jgi:hypothetical protein
MSKQTYAGQCFCGYLQFAVSGPAESLCFCHCTSCRLASGAPYLAWGSFLKGSFHVTQGELTLHNSSEPVERGFCGKCGSTISYFHSGRPDYIDITLVTLDESDELRPMCHIWVSNKDPAVIIGDDLPRYDQWRTG